MIKELKQFQELFLAAKRREPEALDNVLACVAPIFRSYGRIYKDVYKTVMQDEDDMMQVGLIEAVRSIDKYTFRCRCSVPFASEKAFLRHIKVMHKGRGNPQPQIWRYIDFRCRRYIRNAMKVERKTSRTKAIPYDPYILDQYEGTESHEGLIVDRALIQQIFKLTEAKLDQETFEILWKVLEGNSYAGIARDFGTEDPSLDINSMTKREIGRKARDGREKLERIISQLDIEPCI